MRDSILADRPLRSPAETRREIAELRETLATRIAPEDFDRHRERARQLRKEAQQHLLDLALASARSRIGRLFERGDAPDVEPTPRST